MFRKHFVYKKHFFAQNGEMLPTVQISTLNLKCFDKIGFIRTSITILTYSHSITVLFLHVYPLVKIISNFSLFLSDAIHNR